MRIAEIDSFDNIIKASQNPQIRGNEKIAHGNYWKGLDKTSLLEGWIEKGR